MKISLEIIIKILHTAFKSLDQALNAPLIHSHHESNAYTVFVKYYIKYVHGYDHITPCLCMHVQGYMHQV